MMGTSLVNVLTIVGKAADEVESACEELLGRRVQQNPTSYGSTDWNERDHKDIEELCLKLIGASRSLPVIYYGKYLDSWTIANGQFQMLSWPDGRRLQICGSTFGLAYYPSRFSQVFIQEIEKLRIGDAYHLQRENRWYLYHLKEAIDAALWLEDRFLVVGISETIGPSRHDDEIKASLNMSLQLPE